MHLGKGVVIVSVQLALAFAGTTRSQAQDFYHPGVSAESAGRAGIYAPETRGTAGDVIDAIALNPAGLEALRGPAANLLLMGGVARGSFSDPANDDSRMRSRPAFVPFGAVGGSLPGGRWKWGAGFTPDFVSSVNWHYADSPGTGGADYGSQAEKSEIVVLRGAGGLSFAPTPRFSIGATVGVVYDENTLITPFIFQSNPALKGLKTLLDLHARGFGWGGSAGVLLHPVPSLTFGAAYSSPYSVHSHGHASGNMGVQFAVLDIPFTPDFTYRAEVGVKLPQSAIAMARWQPTPSLGISLQADFVNFHSAFRALPVSLSDGSNADINGFLGSSSIQDRVPLNWSNQYTGRIALDRTLGSHAQIEGGFSRRSSLVPNGTVTPLTGAIMKNGLAAGARYNLSRLSFAGAYSYQFNQSAHVGTSGLLAGEYNNSTLTVGTQAVVLELSLRSK